MFCSSCVQTNTFQVVIASDTTRSFIIFLYEQLQWTTGDASGGSGGLGGTEAGIGLGAGDGAHHFTIAVSNTPQVLGLTYMSNIDTAGVLVLPGGNSLYS